MGLAFALTFASLALWSPDDEDDKDAFLECCNPPPAPATESVADVELLFPPNQEKGMIISLILWELGML